MGDVPQQHAGLPHSETRGSMPLRRLPAVLAALGTPFFGFRHPGIPRERSIAQDATPSRPPLN